MSHNTRSIVLSGYASGEPLRADHFTMISGMVADLQEDEVLVEPITLSVDPYLRSCMTGIDNFFLPQFRLGQVIESIGVARIVESRDPAYQKGNLVEGLLEWSERSIWRGANNFVGGGTLRPIDPTLSHPSHLLGAMGLNGLMAYFGVINVAQPRAGEIMLVSAAAGGVGHLAGQIGRLIGLRVFGMAGSDEKRRLLTESLGFEDAFDYRSEALPQTLAAKMPGGPDIFFDNVGGPISQVVMWNMGRGGRIIECGQIASYDDDGGGFTIDIRPIHANGLRWESFVAPHFQQFFPSAIGQLRYWIEQGQLRALETEYKGIESAPAALVGMLSGANTGKMIVTL